MKKDRDYYLDILANLALIGIIMAYCMPLFIMFFTLSNGIDLIPLIIKSIIIVAVSVTIPMLLLLVYSERVHIKSDRLEEIVFVLVIAITLSMISFLSYTFSVGVISLLSYRESNFLDSVLKKYWYFPIGISVGILIVFVYIHVEYAIKKKK